jgi:hypothetical protein
VPEVQDLLASHGHEVLRSKGGKEEPPLRPYLVISELSRKLSSGLGAVCDAVGEGLIGTSCFG